MPEGSAIRIVAVIGAGHAGRSFAMACAAAGLYVALEDVMPAKLRRAEVEYADLSLRGGFGELQLASTVEEAVREADIVIDFVPDELESKLEIFSMIDRMAPPKSIICTPSESQSITDLASCVYRPDRCVALRESSPRARTFGFCMLLRPARRRLAQWHRFLPDWGSLQFPRPIPTRRR